MIKLTREELLERLDIWWERLKNKDFPLLCEPDRWAIDSLRELIEKSGEGPEDKFIQHIQSHLNPGEVVVCKICGKSAKDIIGGSE